MVREAGKGSSALPGKGSSRQAAGVIPEARVLGDRVFIFLESTSTIEVHGKLQRVIEDPMLSLSIHSPVLTVLLVMSAVAKTS